MPHRTLRVRLCIASLALCAFVGPPMGAQEAQEVDAAADSFPETAEDVLVDGPLRAISLAGAVRVAVDRSPLVFATRLDARKAELEVERIANFWALPQLSFSGLAGIVPAARGDIFNSPDTANDINNLGPFFRGEVGLAVPIYTFGRLEHGANAARAGVEALREKGERTRDEFEMEVVRGYWGLRAAQETLEIFGEMRSLYYNDLLPEVDERFDDADIDPNDAYEIRSARYDIDSAWHEVVEQYRVLQRALADALGEPENSAFALAELTVPRILIGEDDLPRLQVMAATRNPQLRALAAAVTGLEEAMKLERSERWPIIGVGGGFSLAHSPARDDQSNPFIYDEFNFRRLGVALNVRWDLNFARHRIDYLKRQFDRDATAARRDALREKIEIDVHRALERVLKYRDLVDSAIESRAVSRRWLRTALDDFDLGLGEAEPVIKAYRQDYRLQAAIVETQYRLHVSLAELALATGEIHTYLQWVDDGQVALD